MLVSGENIRTFKKRLTIVLLLGILDTNIPIRKQTDSQKCTYDDTISARTKNLDISHAWIIPRHVHYYEHYQVSRMTMDEGDK